MTATARILVLALCSFISVQFFQITNFLVLTQERCQNWPQSFWFDNEQGLSPYWSFSLLFLLAFLWCLAEWHALIFDKTDRFFRVVLLGSVTVLLLCAAMMQSTHWQALEVFAGKRAYDDYWPMFINMEIIRSYDWDPPMAGTNWRYRRFLRDQKFREKYPGEPPGWIAYTWENTCAKGIEIGSLSDDEWDALRREFKDMIFDYYQQQESAAIKANLYRNFGITDD